MESKTLTLLEEFKTAVLAHAEAHTRVEECPCEESWATRAEAAEAEVAATAAVVAHFGSQS